MEFVLRNYRSEYCAELAALFYNTVHSINARDYSSEQLDAWADGKPDMDSWNEKFLKHRTLVAVTDECIVGFADMAEDGYLDRLYVHCNFQGQGIATAICDALEGDSDSKIFTTHASITAKPFFENRGYKAIYSQIVERNGVKMPNYLMKKCCN